MARSTKVQPKGPDWPPDRTLRVLKEQLEKLESFKGKKCSEMEHEEGIWQQMTQAALTHGFGEGSDNVRHFHSARWAGTHSMMGTSPYQEQENFRQRMDKFDATLRSSIAELEASMPEAELRGAYAAGDEYAFYKDLKDTIVGAKAKIFIVDNYLSTEFFELYAAAVPQGVSFLVLTDEVRGNLAAVARKYAASHPLELRSSKEVHDRHVFVDDRGWAVGQSIKDAARRKPTYVVELGADLVPVIRKIYEELWARAVIEVK